MATPPRTPGTPGARSPVRGRPDWARIPASATYDCPVLRRRLAAFVAGGLWTIALVTACDSGPRQRGGPRQRSPRRPQSPRRSRRGWRRSATPRSSRRSCGARSITAFEPMPEPGPDDWLAQHPEKPQTYEDYLRADRNVPNPQRNVIYLLPIGDFPATAPPLARSPDRARVLHARGQDAAGGERRRRDREDADQRGHEEAPAARTRRARVAQDSACPTTRSG